MERPQHTGSNVLKVDATAITDTENRAYTVIYNVNIPEDIIDDVNERRDILERTRSLIDDDFPNIPVYYQITACYDLMNKVTGFTVRWTGSFFSENNGPSQLTPFQRFESGTFVDTSFDNCENVRERLTWTNEDTQWVFHELVSVIFNFNINVRSNHPVLQDRRLHYGRLSRPHVTFDLP